MAKNRKTILINHRFFDGVENRLHEGQALVINDGRIEAAVPQTELPRDSEYAIVDLKGLTLLPGLIDNHVHIALPLITRPSNKIAFEIKNQIRKNLKTCIATGVTTVRDVGAVPGWMKLCRSMLAKDPLMGPRVLTTNSAITAPGGCPDWVPYFSPLTKLITGGGYKESPATPAQAEKLVEKMIAAGADWIKVYFQSKSWLLERQQLPVFDEKTFRTIVDTAHKHGRQVCCHAIWQDDIGKALTMGIRSTEHSLIDVEIPDKLVDGYLKNDVALHPTLTYLDIMGNRAMKQEFYQLVCDRGASFLEPESLRQVKEFYDIHLKNPFPPDLAECRRNCYDNVSLFESGYQRAKRNALKLQRAGVKVGVASDSGGSCMSYFGVFYREELKRLVDSGFSNYEALKAATSVNAAILGLDDRIGSLRQGRLADIVAVDGNPLESLTALQNIRMVFKEGAQVKL